MSYDVFAVNEPYFHLAKKRRHLAKKLQLGPTNSDANMNAVFLSGKINCKLITEREIRPSRQIEEPISTKYHSPSGGSQSKTRNPCACVKESEEAVSWNVRLCQFARSDHFCTTQTTAYYGSTQQRNSSLQADLVPSSEGSEFCHQMLPFPRCIE